VSDGVASLIQRDAGQERTNLALIESNLEFIAGELGRLPTHRDLAKAALGIIFASAGLVIPG
jgi:hypothetical protein